MPWKFRMTQACLVLERSLLFFLLWAVLMSCMFNAFHNHTFLFAILCIPHLTNIWRQFREIAALCMCTQFLRTYLCISKVDLFAFQRLILKNLALVFSEKVAKKLSIQVFSGTFPRLSLCCWGLSYKKRRFKRPKVWDVWDVWNVFSERVKRPKLWKDVWNVFFL